jgi:glycerophosphoryl diester phosphodiesterase
MSFSVAALRRCVDLLPQTPLVLLVDDRPPRGDVLASALQSGLPMDRLSVGPAVATVRRDPHAVARAHRAGLGVHVWPVDRPDDVELCLRLGVDVIITNDPQRAQCHRRLSLIRPHRDAVPWTLEEDVSQR